MEEQAEVLRRIGANITRIRKSKKISSKDLGDYCEMEKSNLIPIEKGRINTTIGTLVKIANALEVSLEDLINTK